MSGQRAAAEPYTTRFETTVTAIDDRTVRLETSYFYGEGGGQPTDRGTIDGVPVVDVQYVDGEQRHVLAEEPSFKPDQHVLCSIDWSFRMYCMRAHTASHILYGAGRRLLDDLGYGGFDISDEKVRVDLETSTTIDDGTLVGLNELVNRAVWESRPVSWDEIPVAEARERDEIAFNEATKEGAFQNGQIRIVTIGNEHDNGNGGRPNSVTTLGSDSDEPWDVAACGGTHVRNTREVGPVTVLDRSNPGEGLTRIELAVGPKAIERRTAEKRTAYDTKRTLGVSLTDVPDEIERLTDERDDIAAQLADRERSLVAERLATAASVDRNGETWLTTSVGDLPSETVSDVVRERIGSIAADREIDAIVAVGGSEGDPPFAVVGTTESRSAAAVLDELTDEFGGGGGGSETIATGGGFDATAAELLDAIE